MSGIRLVGQPGAYADGAEDRVLHILKQVGDRATSSDQLAHYITDWSSRYHFSRLRANLLRPLQFGPGLRVLDVGAGTGALARYMGETGASVVALEGSLLRARAAAARCDGLANVEVVCGPLDAFTDDDGFDVVLCIGVLEYAADDPRAFLTRLGTFLRPGAAVVLAIENQLGLKYLLGYGEDHIGEPWVGVEGYPTPEPARTWSRRTLGRLLGETGLVSQRWLYPFPDYKLPTVILDEAAYDEENAVDLVDQLVRWPCTGDASPPSRLCDDRQAHRVFLDAGLGRDVANSFLVIASPDASAPSRLIDSESSAWLYGSDRLALWLRARSFGRGDKRHVTPLPLVRNGRIAERGWLRQQLLEQPRVIGQTVEQLALTACTRLKVDELGEVLRRWRDHLRIVEVEKDSESASLHPFRPRGEGRLLPADHLDVCLGNFIVDDAGELHYIDREWRAANAVDADLVCLRALWYFAADVVLRGVRHPWPLAATVDELAQSLAQLCETGADLADLDRFRMGEAALQEKVAGYGAAGLLSELESMGRTSQLSPRVARHLPFTTLRHDLAVTGERLSELEAERERSAEQLREAQAAAKVQTALLHEESTALRHQIDELEQERQRLAAALAATQTELASFEEPLEEGRRAITRLAAIDRRKLVRLYRTIRHPFRHH